VIWLLLQRPKCIANLFAMIYLQQTIRLF